MYPVSNCPLVWYLDSCHLERGKKEKQEVTNIWLGVRHSFGASLAQGTNDKSRCVQACRTNCTRLSIQLGRGLHAGMWNKSFSSMEPGSASLILCYRNSRQGDGSIEHLMLHFTIQKKGQVGRILGRRRRLQPST